MSRAPSSTSPQVLIVGAGPSGLILALMLLENGIPVRIIDKELAHRVGAKGAGIQPRSLELYKFLGLWPDIQKQAARTPPMRLYASPDGITPVKTWFLSESAEPTPSCPFMSSLMLGQDHLEEIMRTHLLARFGVSVELGTELNSFKQNEEDVTAHLRKRVAGLDKVVDETLKLEYLVGTDGGRSIVRKTLGLKFLGETREENWVLYGDVEVKGLDRDHWHMWGSNTTGGVTLRAPDGTDNPYFALIGGAPGHSEAEARAIGDDPVRCEQFFRDVTGRTDIEFGKWIYLTAHRPNIRMVDTFQKGRVFIAGDAAHTHSPTGGQGLNSSVQDSFNLGWKLALVLKHHSPTSLLDSYTAERLPVIAEMLERTTALLNQTLELRFPVAGAVPDTSNDHSGWRRGRALWQLGVNYRWSDIVLDERVAKPNAIEGAYGAVGGAEVGPVRAGDRAPDAPGLVVLGNVDGAGATSLFDVFRPTCHTVLLFAPGALTPAEAAAPFTDALQAYPAGTLRTVVILASVPADGTVLPRADLIIVDKEGHAGAGYAVSEAASSVVAVIVRPDGVVGAIALRVEGVRGYFKGIFV